LESVFVYSAILVTVESYLLICSTYFVFIRILWVSSSAQKYPGRVMGQWLLPSSICGARLIL